MDATGPRRFTILDALVLLAATGFGIVGAGPFLADLIGTVRTIDPASIPDRDYWRTVLLEAPSSVAEPSVLELNVRSVLAVMGWDRSPMWMTSHRGQVLVIVQDISILAFPILGCWSIALVLLQWVEPRSTRRSLARQPGLWACGAVVVGLMVTSWLDSAFAGVSAMVIPTGVGLAWLWLRLARRWESQASWLDRLGRVVGWLWLALAVPMAVWSVWVWWLFRS